MPISEFLSRPAFRKYFANAGWLFFGKIIQMLAGLFVGIYVARYLGPSQYGLLNYAIAFVGLFSVVASLGLNEIIVRELVNNPQKKDELLGTAFFLKLIGAILMLGAIIIGMQFFRNDYFTNLLIAIIAASFIFQAFGVIDLNFQSAVKSRYVAQASIIQTFISSIIKLILVWVEAPLFWFAIIILSDAFVLAVCLVWNYLRSGGQIFAWKFRLATARSLLEDSWPIMLAGAAVMIYMKIDQVMIRTMLGNEEVGFYSAAVKLSEEWYFIPMAITSSLFPAIINAKKKSENLYRLRLQQLYDLMVWIALAIALPITFLSPWIIKVLYGSAYMPAASVLSIHIWAGVFVFLGVASGKWLIVENYTRISFFRTFLGAVINIVLNIILIPKYGINGAAIATLISYLTAVFSMGFIPKTNRQAILMLKSINLLGVVSRIYKKYR